MKIGKRSALPTGQGLQPEQQEQADANRRAFIDANGAWSVQNASHCARGLSLGSYRVAKRCRPFTLPRSVHKPCVYLRRRANQRRVLDHTYTLTREGGMVLLSQPYDAPDTIAQWWLDAIDEATPGSYIEKLGLLIWHGEYSWHAPVSTCLVIVGATWCLPGIHTPPGWPAPTLVWPPMLEFERNLPTYSLC